MLVRTTGKRDVANFCLVETSRDILIIAMQQNFVRLGCAVAVLFGGAPHALIAQSSLVTLATYFGGSGPDQLVAVRGGSDGSIVIAGNT